MSLVVPVCRTGFGTIAMLFLGAMIGACGCAVNTSTLTQPIGQALSHRGAAASPSTPSQAVAASNPAGGQTVEVPAFVPIADRYRDLATRVTSDPDGVLAESIAISDERPSDFEPYLLMAQAHAAKGEITPFVERSILAQFVVPATKENALAELLAGISSALYADHGTQLLARATEAQAQLRWAQAAELFANLVRLRPEDPVVLDLAANAAIASSDSYWLLYCLAALRESNSAAAVAAAIRLGEEQSQAISKAIAEGYKRVCDAFDRRDKDDREWYYRLGDTERLVLELAVLSNAGDALGTAMLAIVASNLGLTSQSVALIAKAHALGYSFFSDKGCHAPQEASPFLTSSNLLRTIMKHFGGQEELKLFEQIYGRNAVSNAWVDRGRTPSLQYSVWSNAGLWVLNPRISEGWGNTDQTKELKRPQLVRLTKSGVNIFPSFAIRSDIASYKYSKDFEHWKGKDISGLFVDSETMTNFRSDWGYSSESVLRTDISQDTYSIDTDSCTWIRVPEEYVEQFVRLASPEHAARLGLLPKSSYRQEELNFIGSKYIHDVIKTNLRRGGGSVFWSDWHKIHYVYVFPTPEFFALKEEVLSRVQTQ